MSKLERAFISTADKTYKKVKAKDGRIMHFKDGTPIKKGTFNMVATRYNKVEGEFVEVAVPSDKGPGYTRKKVVSTGEASALGQELQLSRDDVPGQPRETVTIDGETYDTSEIIELNQRIINRHGHEAVFKYK